MSKLALEIIAKEKKERTGKLDLGKCGLKKIPEEVFECEWLTVLILSNEYWDIELRKTIKSINKGEPNKLTFIPDEIINLNNLHTLRLGGTYKNCFGIKDISCLQCVKNLKVLSIRYNQITKLENLPERMKELDISYNQITKLENLPAQLNSLSIISNQITTLENLPAKLKELSISYNQIFKLENLPAQLNLLDISSNQITKLENLPAQLNSLDISSNQIAKLENLSAQLNLLSIISNQITKLENLPVQLNSLYISSNQITKLENLPAQLNLLDISSNQITKLENLPAQLNSLDISFNQITKLENLPLQLNSLSIISNQITKLENLPLQLISLSIISNQITKLENLPAQLNSLSISFNQITQLENLPEQLKELDISSNQITKLENVPAQLNSLYISDNQIIKLENLPAQLKELDISDNQITKLENLPAQLNSLYIISNQITKLENLPAQLKELSISYNQITKLENLSAQLKELYIISNHITKLENLPTQLNSLYISSNQISDLTPIKQQILSGQLNPVLKSRYKLNELMLENNPLVAPPPEIIKRGRGAVISYFDDIEKQGVSYIYEAKVLVVGDARVGKTTLCSKLQNINAPLPQEEDSTKGIDILPLNFKLNNNELKANVWDFGGQEIYHSTHQFFLTKRSLYIFVDDNSRDDIEYDYWFQAIELFSKNCPVIVLQNRKADRHKEFDSRGFKSRFKNIKEVFSIDLSLNNEKDKQEFKRFENEIQHQLSNLPHIGQELPKQWVEIRNKIGELAKDNPNLTLNEYYKICSDLEVDDRKKALEISGYLHDLGILLHFQDNDLLCKTIILQKEWATNAVYKIIDDEIVISKKGRFCKKDACNIWSESKYHDLHAEFLSLMKTFELIYTLSDTEDKEFLIPKLLPVEQPELNWDYQNNIQMKFEYDFMPKGLISRTVVRQHRYIPNLKFVWRKGVVLERRGSKALIIENYDKKKIEVWVKGTFAKDLMTIIKDDFDVLHNQFEGLKVKKLIPCNCKTCVNSQHPHFYQHESLLRRIEKGKETIECDISFDDVMVNGLIEGIFVENFKEEPLETFIMSKKLFISYSKHDENLKNEFIKHLSVLKANNYISVWHDGVINPGEKWDDKIKNNLNDSDIVIFLVSHNLLSTEYVMDFELQETLKGVEEGSHNLVPVILDYCDWKDSQLGKFQSANTKAVELKSFSNINEGFLQVINNLKEIIKN